VACWLYGWKVEGYGQEIRGASRLFYEV
jgi:hypothetical protein